jgi:hypothetical protein
MQKKHSNLQSMIAHPKHKEAGQYKNRPKKPMPKKVRKKNARADKSEHTAPQT